MKCYRHDGSWEMSHSVAAYVFYPKNTLSCPSCILETLLNLQHLNGTTKANLAEMEDILYNKILAGILQDCVPKWYVDILVTLQILSSIYLVVR